MFDYIDWKILAFKVKEKVFFKEDTPIARKTRSSIAFTLLIQVEWIKASHLEKYIIYVKKIIKHFISTFYRIFLLPSLHYFEVIVA